MARKATAKKSKFTPSRKSAASKLLEERHIGTEIVDWSEITDVEAAMQQCFNHYNYFYDFKDANRWAKRYVKKNFPKKLKFYNVAEPWRTSITVGAMCRMIENGAVLPEHNMKWLHDHLEEIFTVGKSIYAKNAENERIIPRKNPNEIIKEKTSTFISEIDDVLDMFWENVYVDWENYSVYNELQKIEAAPQIAKGVIDYFTPLRDEWNEIVKNKDPQLKEAYGHMTAKDKKLHVKILNQILSDAEMYLNAKKATRKPRAKKAKSAAQIVSKMQYQKTSPEFKITSVDPANIVGAKTVLLFNTKYRQVIILEAEKTFAEISGSTIKGIDMDASMRKTLRKPEEQLSIFLTGTKAKIKREFNSIKTKAQAVTPRLNNDTIIMKVFK